MQQKSSLFRRSALEQLSSPEQLDTLMQVTTPAGWLALLAIVILLVALILWSLVGQLPSKVGGQGILIAPGGVNTVVSPVAGQVVDVYYSMGDEIQIGSVVARIAEAGKTLNTKVISPYAGRILEVQMSADNLVERGTPILSVETLGEGESDQIHPMLEAVIYVSPTEGKKILPGMKVEISPSTVRSEEYGYIIGQVTSVGEFPATRQGMMRVLGNEQLIDVLLTGGAPIEVRVDLRVEANTLSGYAWTSSQGPPVRLDGGTLCNAFITVSQQRPISLVLPILR